MRIKNGVHDLKSEIWSARMLISGHISLYFSLFPPSSQKIRVDREIVTLVPVYN